jgi:hypothetical protein
LKTRFVILLSALALLLPATAMATNSGSDLSFPGPYIREPAAFDGGFGEGRGGGGILVSGRGQVVTTYNPVSSIPKKGGLPAFLEGAWISTNSRPGASPSGSLSRMAELEGSGLSSDFAGKTDDMVGGEVSIIRYVGKPLPLFKDREHTIDLAPTLMGHVQYGYHINQNRASDRETTFRMEVAGLGEAVGTAGLTMRSAGFTVGTGVSLGVGGAFTLAQQSYAAIQKQNNLTIGTAFLAQTSWDVWSGVRLADKVEGRARYRLGTYITGGQADPTWWDFSVGVLFKL